MAKKGQYKAKTGATAGMPVSAPYIPTPLTTHTRSDYQSAPTAAAMIAARNAAAEEALLSQSVPMSVLARGNPEVLDQ